MQTPSLPAAVTTPEPRTLPTHAAPLAGSPATPPSRVSIEGTVIADRVYRAAILGFALCVPILLLLIFIEVGLAGWPALRQFGFGFLTTSTWDPVAGQFGALPAIAGTIITSIIALVIATPLALGGAIFLSDFAPSWVRQPLAFLIDLLAAVPSVVYGLWGVFFLLPLLREDVMPFLRDTLHLGATPFFRGPAYGPSVLAAGLILSIMVLPYIAAVSREVLMAVPRSQREAALALGATRWETITGAVIPFARSGIIGGVILGLGRALGETMAVTMVIGNRHEISASLFAPGYTMASLIANEFSEATNDVHLSALMAVGFVLLLITLVVNAIARWLVWQTGGSRS
jgi:phosphate transport system permease protein